MLVKYDSVDDPIAVTAIVEPSEIESCAVAVRLYLAPNLYL